jgi:predicted permease
LSFYFIFAKNKVKMSTENKKKENILVNLCFNIIIPALILSKLSKPAYLGPLWGLVIALTMVAVVLTAITELAESLIKGKDDE